MKGWPRGNVGFRTGARIGAVLAAVLLAAVAAVDAGASRRAKLPPETLRGPAYELDQYPTPALATPSQRVAAERLWAELKRAAAGWRDPRAAARAGFDTQLARRPPARVGYLHAEHRRFSHDRRYLDPRRPETLVYANVPGRKLVLVGVMFSMPRGKHGPTPGGSITRWHFHRVCARGDRRGLTPRPDGSCPPGSRRRPGSEMMHVWFTRDLRSRFAIHAPEPELCKAGLLPAWTCSSLLCERPRSSAATTADAPRRAGASIALAEESYGAGERATLRVFEAVGVSRLQVFRVGAVKHTTRADDLMLGSPVSAVRQVGPLRAGSQLSLHIGNWPSGLYFARLENRGRLGFAPFVVRPPAGGSHRVAVVMPTRTWQAYNFRDDDGDGRSDTWYAASGRTARLGRPFLNRGVPPHFRRYDVRFLNWLHDTHKLVDVLSQAELDAATGIELAVSYDLIVFPGHHEYVTEQEYDAVTAYRGRGGNLAFLSANNFFWRIVLNGDAMARTGRWRRLGRAEAALIGVQYLANDRGQRQGPWRVRRAAPASAWLFAGVDLRRGNEFSRGGVEIDHTTSASPRGTQVVAEIPNAVGPGLTAQMTYYETAAGARVFAAGAFTLAGRVYEQGVQQLLENLWRRLSRP